ncbi:cytochrome b [Legionella brunensis]|uniref:Cytochrome b-561 transmembrane protein n=1 Tax=Legionella brunensis TaxID=29422 RepID=A0A0W0STU1_9GAMM|nr:cytochrome b [Legionella brunensis]KTC86692.1 cytochrome b-561 transmembrane protein [Legionella brunensis]
MTKNFAKEYSKGFKFVHWLVALLVIIMLCVGFFLDDIPEQYQPIAYLIHKSVGLTILFLMIFRTIMVAFKGRLPLPESVPLWEKLFSRLVQYSFYIFLILMPLSGWIMSVAANRIPSFFGLFLLPIPGIEPNEPLAHFMADVHSVIAWILIVLATLHISGALKHHFYDKDEVLRRMLP